MTSLVQGFEWDRSTGEWDHVVSGDHAQLGDAYLEKIRSISLPPLAPTGGFSFEMAMGLLRCRRPSILDIPPRRRGDRRVARHLRLRWVDTEQQQRRSEPPRKNYRTESQPWVDAMHKSRQRNPHLPLASAYHYAVLKLGEPPGKGRPESKRARVIKLYQHQHGNPRASMPSAV